MNRNQAELLSAGYRHVLTVGEMDSGNPIPDEEIPCCFVGEMVRADLLPYDEYIKNDTPSSSWAAKGFSDKFGVPDVLDRTEITIGDYETGPECAAIVKSLLSKYGYELDDNGYITERNFAQEQYQKAINGPKLVEVAAA